MIPPLETSRNAGRHVLVVEDDPELRKVISLALRSRGFGVHTAGTAEEVLALTSNPDVPIDVMVMDLVLPDSWGSQLALEQSLFRPDVKVIFISGHSEGDELLRASTASSDIHFLAKPFPMAELASLVRSVLDGDEKGGKERAEGGAAEAGEAPGAPERKPGRTDA